MIKVMSDSRVVELGARYSLDELVAVANRLLPRFLPQERRGSKLNEAVNPRLVRHLSTLGLLDEAGREGREARYEHRHLLQLLVARRLMAQGYSTGAIKKLTRGARDDELEALLHGGAQLTVAAPLVLHGATARHSAEIETDSLETSAFDALSPEASSAAPREGMAAASLARRAMKAQPTASASEVKSGSEARSDNAALSFLENIRSGRKPKSPAPAASSAASSAASQAAPLSPLASSDRARSPDGVEAPRYVRIEVRRGLEIHVGDEFELPPSASERETLMEDVLRELKTLHLGKGGRKHR